MVDHTSGCIGSVGYDPSVIFYGDSFLSLGLFAYITTVKHDQGLQLSTISLYFLTLIIHPYSFYTAYPRKLIICFPHLSISPLLFFFLETKFLQNFLLKYANECISELLIYKFYN